MQNNQITTSIKQNHNMIQSGQLNELDIANYKTTSANEYSDKNLSSIQLE
uniref:Uncharacterized protein n=1 Tax=Arundo donax TaxID=35708 RepID=A0A0A9A0E2_ARUDO